MSRTPVFDGNISFNAHHSPMGAYLSFTCGHFGSRGGLAAEAGRPAEQDIYIGIKHGDRRSDAPLRCLPFYQGAADRTADYALDQSGQKPPPRQIQPYAADQIRRHYGWASDRWVTPDFEFTIYTPFGEIPDPLQSGAITEQMSLLPAVVAEMVVDNTAGSKRRTGFFALAFPQSGAHLLDSGLGHQRVGFAHRGRLGVAAQIFEMAPHDKMMDSNDCCPFSFQRWNPADGLADVNPIHRLGNCPGVGFEVPPGKKVALRLALGCFLDGIVTTRIEGRYLYTRYFANLVDVLDDALTMFDSFRIEAEALDEELLDSGLSPQQQFLLAHATRSYYGSTQLLEVGGLPFWIVNEGEYCMMNTLDLSVDHLFWELHHNPWTVRNLLDNFVRHYSYHDQVKDPKTQQLHHGGISFCHDMGVHNNFAPFGHSSYELPNLDGCFSYMTQEQLCNWVLLAASYVAKTADTRWLRENIHIVQACAASLAARAPDGILMRDSSRCEGGQEITTYDSLDASLGQARHNLYLAVKCWAAYAGLEMLFLQLPDELLARNCRQMAGKLAAVAEQHLKEEGFIPAILEQRVAGYESRILPAIEGLVYPWYWAAVGGESIARVPDESEEVSALYDALRRHTLVLLNDQQRRNLFPDGGLRLSSTSDNSWMSKIAIFQHVARAVFNLDEDAKIGKLFEKADAAHVRWQTEGDSAYWAVSDQIVNGVARGSKYYPRCVTALLWMLR